MRAIQLLTTGLCLVVMTACTPKQAPQVPPPTPATPAAPAPPKSTTKATTPHDKPDEAKPNQANPAQTHTPPARAKAIPQAKIQALLATWLKAQNSGNFEAYRSVFAKRMTGVKRSGNRTTHFGRDGWLRDRKRMFKKAMEVKADQLVITTSAHTAVVRFRQTWNSGTYQDVGPKQLLVVREGDGVRIAREEMLDSLVLSSAHRNAKLRRTKFAFVVKVGGQRYVVIGKGAEDGWATW